MEVSMFNHMTWISSIAFVYHSLLVCGAAVLIITTSATAQSATEIFAHNGLFHVSVQGRGEPVILIPGLSSSGDVWDGTVAHLKANHQCHVLTLAGFAGQPAWPAVDQGKFLISVEDELATYIHQQNLRQPVIIGHSLGGEVALEFAIRYPALAGRLIIVDSMPFLAGEFFQVDTVAQGHSGALKMRASIKNETHEQYLDFVKSGAATRGMVTSDADFTTLTKWGLTSDQPTVAEALYELLEIDLRPRLGEIHQPTLVFASCAGWPDTFRDQAQQIFDGEYQGLKQKEIVMAGKERHFIMLDNPTWFYSQIDRFLAASSTVVQVR
jgi:N-formylmaleamate deformylase